MIRLIIFGLTLVGFVFVMNLKDYGHFEVSKKRFNFEEKKASNEAKKKEIEELAAAKMKHEEVVVEVVKEGPLVELTTEELKRGAALFKKCIVCHGKRGEGKKSQAAPAIGGQFDWYVELQVTNMQKKVRINKVMDPYIKKLSAGDIKDLAAYISALPLMGKK